MRNTSCMYFHLPREDGDSNENNSVSNQRQIIKSYAKEKNIDLSYEKTIGSAQKSNLR